MVYTTHKNGDEWGMVHDIAIPILSTSLFEIAKLPIILPQGTSLGIRADDVRSLGKSIFASWPPKKLIYAQLFMKILPGVQQQLTKI